MSGYNDMSGDANTFLQSMFVSAGSSPFGSQHISMHEIGFNKREIAPTTQPPADGHPGRMEFKVSSTLGHLAHQFWLRAKFTVEVKSTANLGAHIGDALQNDALQQKLENVKCHPDMILGMLDNVEMRQNSVVFQRLKRKNMRTLRREQYNKDDHELQTRLVNGGMPKYHYLKQTGTTINGDQLSRHLCSSKAVLTTPDADATNASVEYVYTPYEHIKAGDGMHDGTSRYKSQWEELQLRVPDDEPTDLWDDYRPEFHQEIGLKDVSDAVLSQSNAGLAYKPLWEAKSGSLTATLRSRTRGTTTCRTRSRF